MTALLDTLTDEQRGAAEAEAPWVSVSAPSGSGKTRVLAARIAHLIDSGIHPGDICAFTFTRAAAAEISARVTIACGPVAHAVTISTFHAFAAKHVVPQTMRVATEVEMTAAVRSLYEGPTRRPKHAVPGIQALERAIIAHEATPEDTPFASAVNLVRTRLLHANLVPTWDLVPACIHRFDGRRFAHVLVDEAQDATRNEAVLAHMLVEDGGELFTVGDPRQAIFQWRGADPEAFLRQVPLPPTAYALARTFRFGPGIADVANEIAAQFGADPIDGADIDSRAVEAISVADALSLGLSCDIPAGGTVVLCRTHFECAEVLGELGDGMAVHVQRDPYMDFDGRHGDAFRSVAAAGKVAIATCHGFKGLEAQHVVLAPSLDPRIHPRRGDEDEWRTKYVAATRAKRLLTIVRPENSNDPRSEGG